MAPHPFHNALAALLLVLLVALPTPSPAAQPAQQLSPEMERLIEQKVAELLAERLADLDNAPPHSISKPTVSKGEQHQLVEEVTQALVISGLVEVEASYSDDTAGHSSSALELATVELALDAQAHPWVQGHVLFLYEEGGDDDVIIDEAFLTLGNRDQSPFYLSAGRMFVPFGNFSTFMISDPLTLELAETKETAIKVGMDTEHWHSSIYAFNGDTSEGDDNSTIEQFGVHLGYSTEQQNWALQLDSGFTSSLFDSDLLSEEFDAAATEGDYIPALALHALLQVGDVTLIGEYISALEQLRTDDGSINPYTFNLEAAYAFNLLGYDSTVSVAWQGSDDLAGIIPETRLLTSVGFGLFEDTALTVEYAYDEDYSSHEGGSDEDSSTLTAQLAYEF